MGAYNAGIKEGDVLISVDNIKIKKFSDLTGYLESKRPTINLDFRNDSKST